MVPKPASQSHHAIFHIVRLSTTTTARTFVSRPARLNLWKYVERHNNVIILSKEERFNLDTMGVIEGHDMVLRGMIIGVNSRLHCLWSPTTTNRAREILATNFIEDI